MMSARLIDETPARLATADWVGVTLAGPVSVSENSELIGRVNCTTPACESGPPSGLVSCGRRPPFMTRTRPPAGGSDLDFALELKRDRPAMVTRSPRISQLM